MSASILTSPYAFPKMPVEDLRNVLARVDARWYQIVAHRGYLSVPHRFSDRGLAVLGRSRRVDRALLILGPLLLVAALFTIPLRWP